MTKGSVGLPIDIGCEDPRSQTRDLGHPTMEASLFPLSSRAQTSSLVCSDHWGIRWLAKTSQSETKRHAFYHQWAVSTPLCSICAGFGAMHHEAVKQTNPDFDALMVFLANWEAIERSALGRILTAGQLADVQELERLFALPAEDPA
jgi:hypothetical protein